MWNNGNGPCLPELFTVLLAGHAEVKKGEQMRRTYRKVEDVLRSPIRALLPPDNVEKADWILRSTRLEDSIYADLR